MSATGRGEVVFTFSTADWRGAWQRGFHTAEDRLAASLLASRRVERLLVCGAPRNRAIRSMDRLRGRSSAPFDYGPRVRLAEPTWWLRRQLPATGAEARRVFGAYDRKLAAAASSFGLHQPHVITSSPFVAGFCELPWASSVTWYAVDDWAEHPAYGHWRDLFLEVYEQVRVRGRGVAAISQPLLERLAPAGPATVAPCGIDPDEWIDPGQVPTWAASLPRPIHIYVGALDERIRTDWVVELAQAQPDATILFVGPLVDASNFAAVAELPNIVIHPPVDRSTICALVQHADVGLLPHHVTRLTMSMSPLKLFEYLASGLPVAASDLPSVRALADPRVALVGTDGDFVSACAAALELGRGADAERRRFISENSWESRHERILDLAFG